MSHKYSLIGAAFGLAAGMPETEGGPQAIREAGLLDRLSKLGISINDRGDIKLKSDNREIGDKSRKYLDQILEFGQDFSLEISSSYEAGETPVILGGDHSTSIFSISAAVNYLKVKKGKDARLGVLWVDAHSDINTPDTTLSGNIHGMSMAVLLGHGDDSLCNLYNINPKVKSDDIAFIGLRDVDPPEKKRIRELGLCAYSMTEIDRCGLGEVLVRALTQITKDTDGFVVSMDLDVCDPRMAPGVGTPVRGGLTFRESHLVMETIAKHPKLLSFELMEYNPVVDVDHQTAEAAISLIESGLGKDNSLKLT